jgi:hypothetical protein
LKASYFFSAQNGPSITHGSQHNGTSWKRATEGQSFGLMLQLDLTPRALEALRRHRISQYEERLKAGASWADNDLIFPTRKGALMRPSTVTDNHFNPLLDRV